MLFQSLEKQVPVSGRSSHHIYNDPFHTSFKEHYDDLSQTCSTWIMLNLKTRKLAKYPDEMKEKMKFLAPKPPRYGC